MDISSTSAIVANYVSWPIEWLVIAGLAVFVVLYTMRAGTGAATALALSFPLATFLYQESHRAAFLKIMFENFSDARFELLVFAAILVLVILMLYRIVTNYDSLTGGSIFGVLSALAVGILLVVTWLQVPALDSLWHISAPIAAVFSEEFRFWWTIMALGVLTYVRS